MMQFISENVCRAGHMCSVSMPNRGCFCTPIEYASKVDLKLSWASGFVMSPGNMSLCKHRKAVSMAILTLLASKPPQG